MNADEYNRRVLSTLEAIQKDVTAIKRTLAAGNQASGGGGGDFDRNAVADDHDLDGPHGDPSIRFMPKPKYWVGDDFTGYKLSETTPDFLDAYAKYMDACAFMASKDADEKKRSGARFKAKDAARARGHAARMRANPGARPPAPEQGPEPEYGDEDSLPF